MVDVNRKILLQWKEKLAVHKKMFTYGQPFDISSEETIITSSCMYVITISFNARFSFFNLLNFCNQVNEGNEAKNVQPIFISFCA